MNTPQLPILSLLLALTATTISPVALADDDDKAACAALEEGDDCTRGDGDPGFCIPDESDPNVLTCDDDTSGLDDADDGGCSVGGDAASSSLSLVPFGLVMWWLRRRRR